MGSQIKSLEAADVNSRKTFEEKFRKLEDDRMSALSQKNTELQRALEEGRSYAESLKGRETELRRLGNELEVARKTIGNLDQKSKDYDEKIKGVNRVYQT
jgi:phage shock protein A